MIFSIQLTLHILIHVRIKCLDSAPRQSKITQQRLTILINQNIPRFQVPMYDSRRMQKVHRAQQVVHYCHHMLLSHGDTVRISKYCIELIVNMFHHEEYEVNLVIIICVKVTRYDIEQFYGINVFFDSAQLS